MSPYDLVVAAGMHNERGYPTIEEGIRHGHLALYAGQIISHTIRPAFSATHGFRETGSAHHGLPENTTLA